MYKKNLLQRSRLTYLLIIPTAICVILIILFALEKTSVINLNTQTDETSQDAIGYEDLSDTQPTNTVDYGPPKPDDSATIPDKNLEQPSIIPVNPELNVTITNSRKSGDLYLIKAVITGTDMATCKATMTNGAASAVASSGAEIIQGQYSCKDLAIPLSQLIESGEWNLEVTAIDKSGTVATTNTKVIL